MNILFHTAAAIGIGHVVASKMSGDPSRQNRGWIAALAFILAFLSHGVLDGLKHLYPLGLGGDWDVPLSLSLLAGWLILIRREFHLLFLWLFLGSILPDLLDHGPAIANQFWGFHLPHPKGKIFPWHWSEGSGSLYDGKNAAVSPTNHLIVLTFIAGAVLTHSRGVFRHFNLSLKPVENRRHEKP